MGFGRGRLKNQPRPHCDAGPVMLLESAIVMGRLDLITDTAAAAGHTFIIALETEEGLNPTLDLAEIAHEALHLIGQLVIEHGFQLINEMLDLIGRQFFKHRINGDQIFNRQAGFGAEVPDLLQRLGIEQHQFFHVEQLVNFDTGALVNLRDSHNLVKADLGEAGDLLDDDIADNGHHALLCLAAQLACRNKGDAVADDDKDIVADDAGWLVTPLGIGNQVRPVPRRGTDMDRAILCHDLTGFQRQRRGRHHPGPEGEQQGGGNDFLKKSGRAGLTGARCRIALWRGSSILWSSLWPSLCNPVTGLANGSVRPGAGPAGHPCPDRQHHA